MTPEEILKDRYKVIASYPHCQFEIGEVLTEDNEDPDMWVAKPKGLRSAVLCDYPGKYSANFKKLEWWEDRDKNHLPKYVRSKTTGEVFKISYDFERNSVFIFIKEGGKAELTLTSFLRSKIPATEEEFKNQTK